MSIQFDTIPIDLRSGGQYVEYNNSRAGQKLAGMPAKVLLIGHMTAAGTMSPLVPTRATDVKAVAGLAGPGSQLHAMFDVKASVDRQIETWMIAAPEDGAAQAATGSCTFNAVPTNAGTFTLRIDDGRVRIAVSAGQAVDSLAAALAGAINAAALPVTATAALGVVTLIARWKGESGNDIDIRAGHYDEEAPPQGLDFTIVAMTGGTANPDIGPVLAAIADDWYTDIICAFTDTANIVEMETEAIRRWSGTVMTDAQFYLGKRGTYGDLATWGNARNSPNLVCWGAYNSPSAPWKWAAALGGICAFEAKQDPARPYQTLLVPATKLLSPKREDRFAFEAREQLLRDGISTFAVDDDGAVRVADIFTMYQRNAYGYEDSSYRKLETVKTLSFMRYSMRARIAQRFPRHKLASDATKLRHGEFKIRPTEIRNELIALAGDWEDAGLAENLEQFKDELQVERDMNDPDRVNAIIVPDVVNQFRIFAARIDFVN